MNLNQMTAYVAVLDTGGFRAAAARLGVTQGAVFRHIRRLESEPGTSLLLEGPPLRMTLWGSRRRALVAPDPAAAFSQALLATDPHSRDLSPLAS